jgi:hypothetical protein
MQFPKHALRCRIAAGSIVLALSGMAEGQVSTSTVKGQVTSGTAAVQGGLAVTAVNLANRNTYRTTTLADGSYVLTGLAPGTYEISVAGPGGTSKTQAITLEVGQTASIDLALGDTAAQTVTVVGAASRQGVRDSQLGTYVSPRMIQALPQTTHNFLSSADLAPGVTFQQAANTGQTRIQSGAQNFDHVNVFIDGVGQKNNILRGGISGQDATRGNPFPQSAIAEYRVLTQNYKAEFEQVSSAAISAITKSGTNELHGEAYVDRTGTNWRARTPFEEQAEANGLPLRPSEKVEYGLSVGGPIKEDVLHFFFAYDGKRIDDSRVVTVQNLNLLPSGAGIVPSLLAQQGSTVDRFKQDLLFGKLDAQISADQRLSASFQLRRETDRVPEDTRLSVPGNDKERDNDISRVDLKHEWTLGSWLSEARVGYEDAVFNPKSASTTPLIRYKVSTASPPSLSSGTQDVIFVGGSPDAQRKQQKGPYVSEELTYTGLAGHVLKGGVKLKRLKYDLSGTSLSVDNVETLIDTVTGLPYYDGTNCTGTNITNGGANSDQCNIRRATAPATAAFSNTQIGVYLQDDWALTKKLELNIGMRYDYETNMLNNDYVTPAARVAALLGPDGRTIGGVTAPPGQTYAQSLALGGIDINQYISNGSSRKSFKGAWAPRIGASYDVFGDRNTVVFGGYGRAYDRTIANHALDELQKNAQPTVDPQTGQALQPEIWLIKNDFKMPYADQYSIGLRQGFGTWNTEVAVSRVHAKNQFLWFFANRDPNGGFGLQSPIDALFGGPTGFGNLVLGDFVGENKTDSVFVKAEKPYTRDSGWGVTVAYTYSDAKTTHNEWNNDIFDGTFGRPGRGFHPSTLVDKHRLVAATVLDGLLPWGLTFAAKAIWASGQPRRVVTCPNGFPDPGIGRPGSCIAVEGRDDHSFRQVDIGVGKEFAWGIHRFSVRADVLNIFNTINYGGYDDFAGAPPAAGNPTNEFGGDNVNFGRPNGMRGDMRTFRLALGYRF